MEWLEDEWIKNPKTVEEVVQCLNGVVMHPAIAFYEGAKYARKIKSSLIHDVIFELKSQNKVPKYTDALIKSIKLSSNDLEIEQQWHENIDDLRILYHASPKGTDRQKNLLVKVAKNKRLVNAMISATWFESAKENFDHLLVEPTWLAVFLADASPASLEIFVFQDGFLKKMNKNLDYLKAFEGLA